MKIPVFGNGDVNSPEKAVEMRDKYGLDGAMIGRASIGNPWFFNQVKHYFKTGEHMPLPSIIQRIKMAEKHLQMAIDWKGEKLGVLKPEDTIQITSEEFLILRNIEPLWSQQIIRMSYLPYSMI